MPCARPWLRAVGGDAILAVAHLLAQFGGALVQPLGGAVHRAMLRRVLVLDVDVHRVVHRGGGDQRVSAVKLHFQHAGEFHRVRVERLLHREQGGVAAGVVGWAGERGLRGGWDGGEPCPDGVDRAHAGGRAGAGRG